MCHTSSVTSPLPPAARLFVLALLAAYGSNNVQCDIQSDAIALNEKASIAFQSGDLSKAAKHFRALDKLVGSVTPVGLTNLAVVYTQANQHAKALKTYKKAVKKFPHDASVALQYCRFGANILNVKRAPIKMDSALVVTVCKKSLKLNPDEPEAAVLLGSVYTLMMQFDKAMPVLRTAVDTCRDNPTRRAMHNQALTNLALSELRAGHPQQALQHTQELYEEYGGSAIETYAHARSIALPYDKEAVRLALKAREDFVNSFKHSGPNCPSGDWRMVWNISEVPSYVSGTTATLLNPTTAYSTYGDKNPVQFVQSTISPYYHKYHEHFVYRLDFHGGANDDTATPSDAFMWTGAGVVHGPCALIGGAYWVMYPTQELSAIPDSVHVRTEVIDDPVVSLLPMYNSANYFHFICEGLVRLLYVLDSVATDPTVKILVPAAMPGGTTMARHIRQTMELMKVSTNRILLFNAQPTILYRFTNRFTVVDWMRPDQDTHGSLVTDSWSPVFPPRGGLHLVRDRFHSILRAHGRYMDTNASSADRRRVVYVSRQRATRMIANEDAIVSALSEALGDGAVEVHTGSEPLLDQVAMFQRAGLVIGAHGAGLSNLVFCEAGTALLLFPMRPHVDHTYGQMAAALDLPHWVLAEISSYYYGQYGTVSDDLIELVVATALDILSRHRNDPGTTTTVQTGSPKDRGDL
eukprot:m.24692 g.24692  ORF g.24692 m.24692 type:complete len:693 (-) comp4181_c0_seq1:4209-6287(-)